MKTAIPPKLANTTDGNEFLILNSWTDDLELEEVMIFLSDVGANVMRRASIWMLDGTFFTALTAYNQVQYHRITSYMKSTYCYHEIDHLTTLCVITSNGTVHKLPFCLTRCCSILDSSRGLMYK